MKKYTVYFAGDLFDHKHLTGNYILAKKIEEISKGHYQFNLPQNWECTLTSSVEVRNRDIASIIKSDFVLFNFDGDDLDSGTVVEFMVAKMLDIPSVLFRTDFRNAGSFDLDWNPMLAGFPRCVISKHHSLLMYNELGVEGMHNALAQSIIDSFEKVINEQSLFACYDDIVSAYEYVIKMCGGKLSELVPSSKIKELVASKIEKNIYATSMGSANSRQHEKIM